MNHGVYHKCRIRLFTSDIDCRKTEVIDCHWNATCNNFFFKLACFWVLDVVGLNLLTDSWCHEHYQVWLSSLLLLSSVQQIPNIRYTQALNWLWRAYHRRIKWDVMHAFVYSSEFFLIEYGKKLFHDETMRHHNGIGTLPITQYNPCKLTET